MLCVEKNYLVKVVSNSFYAEGKNVEERRIEEQWLRCEYLSTRFLVNYEKEPYHKSAV